MMQPIKALMQEHRVIEQVIGCVVKMAETAMASGELNVDHANQAIDFIRHFADHCHHAKEEDQLFALMCQRGFSTEQGPIAAMLEEHQRGRFHARAMREAVAQYAGGDVSAVRQFAAHAHAYSSLLTAHIIKEDFILYPMAQQALNAEDEERLVDDFDKVAADNVGHYERYLQVAAELGEEYKVPRQLEPDRKRLGEFCAAPGEVPIELR
jgi:hemerythrin-like domain-containing protein